MSGLCVWRTLSWYLIGVLIRTCGYCSGFSGITGFMFVRIHSFHLHVQVAFVVGAMKLLVVGIISIHLIAFISDALY